MPKSGKGGSHWSAYKERRSRRDPEWRKFKKDGGPITANPDKDDKPKEEKRPITPGFPRQERTRARKNSA